MKPTTSYFSHSWGLPRAIIKSHLKKKWVEIWGFAFNVSATAEANDFKFGIQLGLAKSHHKITPRAKGRCGLGLKDFPEILGFPL